LRVGCARWSGDINEGPDDPNLISLTDHPYLPTSIFGNQKHLEEQPVLIEAQPVQLREPRLEAQPAVQPKVVALKYFRSSTSGYQQKPVQR
jgi:hypothetical protein